MNDGESKSAFFFFWSFLGPHSGHVEVPRLGVQLAIAAGLCHNHSNARSKLNLQPTPQLTQYQISNPLSEASDRTCIFMDTSQVYFH